MAFGKKKKTAPADVDQSNVALLATKALQEQRNKRLLLVVNLVFTSDVLMHRWTQKAIIEMLGKMVGKPQHRPAKDVTADYEASWYRNEDGVPAIPCRLLKACIVGGAISTDGLTSKAELKRELRVRGSTAPIVMNGDMEMDVRIASNSGTPDMRSRARVPSGSSFEVVLDFPSTMSVDKVMAAVSGGGSTIGLCDWRPEKGGEYGTFEVKSVSSERADVERVLKASAIPEEEYEIPQHLLTAVNSIPEEKLSDTSRKVKSRANAEIIRNEATQRGIIGRPEGVTVGEMVSRSNGKGQVRA